MSICSIEDVASVTTKPFWFQLYVMQDSEFVMNLIDRAKAAKCSALVLTLDLQILGQRHKDLRNGLSAPPKFTPKHIWQMATRPFWCLRMLKTKRRTFGNIVGHAKNVSDLSSLSSWTAEQFDPRLSWEDVAWIKEQWGGPLIIKGILDVEDAKAAAETGADAIIVSNHGGRQLDGAPSSISMLPRIVDAVGDKIEVHLDGGIRSGQDVLKAVALGAKGTYIGRPFLYGLGAMGKEGVTLALDIIRKEMDITMALCGKRDINDVNIERLLPDGNESYGRPVRRQCGRPSGRSSSRDRSSSRRARSAAARDSAPRIGDAEADRDEIEKGRDSAAACPTHADNRRHETAARRFRP